MKNCDDLLLIEYCRREVDDETADGVRAHLEDCARCRKQMQVIEALQQAYGKQPAVRRSRLRIPATVAACGLLAVMVGAVYWLVSPTDHPLHTEPYPVVPLDLRGAGADSTTDAEAFEAYQRGDFETAARLFGSLPPNETRQFFQAVSRFLSGDYELARPALEALAEGSSDWKWPASWYLARILHSKGETSEARRLLEKVSDNENHFQDQAREMLQRDRNRNDR